MPRTGGLIHKKLPPDSVISTREPVKPTTTDVETESTEFEQIGLAELRGTLQSLARRIENRGRIVDEYNSAAITGAGSAASVTVQPTYELMPEKIEAIIVAGPAGAITLQLGDRLLPLTIPASGILVISPIAMILGRSDLRQLTGPAGTYLLELMGVADARFQT